MGEPVTLDADYHFEIEIYHTPISNLDCLFI
jgi:hypothetical protein